MKQTFETITDHMEARKGSIGSSEISTILGLNKYQTPRDLWLLKTGRTQPFEGNEFTRAGHLLEPIIAQMFEEETGYQIEPGSEQMSVHLHAIKPHFSASPDRFYLVDGKLCILECKSTQMEVDPDELPLTWFSQLQWQLGICGVKKGAVAWLTRGVFFGYLEIDFNEEYFMYMAEQADNFWLEYVQKDIEPPLVNVSDVLSKHPSHKDGKSMLATQEVMDVVEELQDIAKEEKALKARKEELKAQIQMTMRDCEAVLYDGKPVITWKAARASQKFDAKRFKSENQNLYSDYLTEVPGSRRFLIK